MLLPLLALAAAGMPSVHASERASPLDPKLCPGHLSLVFSDFKTLGADEVSQSTFPAAAMATEAGRVALAKLTELRFEATLGTPSAGDHACEYFTAALPMAPMGEISLSRGKPKLHVTLFAGVQAYDIFVELANDGDTFHVSSESLATITQQPSLDGAPRKPYVKLGTATVRSE